MKLDRSTTSDALIVHVRESRIDAACAIDFKEAMRDITQTLDCRLILDLAEVGFIDSSGLGAVVAVRKMLRPESVLELARLSPAVEKVFRLTRMDGVFPIHPALPQDLRHAV